MCFFTQQTQTAQQLEKRFKAKVKPGIEGRVKGNFNGFSFPLTPVIAKEDKEQITLFKWGLMPPWEKDPQFAKHTLNARIETVDSKNSFKHFVSNRCLVLVDGFLEWKWHDSKGKHKQGYLIHTAEREAFCIGGIYHTYTDNETGENVGTYSILTTEANALMAEIHNTKKRMPLVLKKEEEWAWLSGEPIKEFADRTGCTLEAVPFGPPPPPTLF